MPVATATAGGTFYRPAQPTRSRRMGASGASVTNGRAPRERGSPRTVTPVEANGDIHFMGDVALMEDSVVLSITDGDTPGDVTFDGDIDTDGSLGTSFKLLSVVTEGTTTLGGDVGGANDLRELLVTGSLALDDGNRRITTTNGVAIGGDVFSADAADDSSSLTIVSAVSVERPVITTFAPRASASMIGVLPM